MTSAYEHSYSINDDYDNYILILPKESVLDKQILSSAFSQRENGHHGYLWCWRHITSNYGIRVAILRTKMIDHQ